MIMRKNGQGWLGVGDGEKMIVHVPVVDTTALILTPFSE